MDDLRRPLLILALVMIGLALLVEIGSVWIIGGESLGDAAAQLQNVSGIPEDARNSVSGGEVQAPPGRGIGAMALLDGVLTFRVGLMAIALVIPARILGRAQGCLTAILGILLLLGGVLALLFVISELIVMVTLFLAAPFGTIAYVVKWGFFPRGDAAILLSLLMVLKLAMVVFLVLAQPKFLQIKALVALVLSSLLANLIVAFLHGLIPNPLTSIADRMAAIVVLIIGLIWALLALVGSLWGIVKAIRVDRALSR